MEENMSLQNQPHYTYQVRKVLADLSAFVFDFNRVSAAGWLFARSIFLAELERDPSWDPGALLDQAFCEVLLSLIDHKRCAPRVAKGITRHNIRT